jgi:AcrR family transcriptional regulator
MAPRPARASEPVPEPWRGEPLPRGRHKLSAETVRASQRERLLRAMLECVSERGFAETTIGDIVSAARASRNSFYEQFANKTECFLTACDQVADELLSTMQRFTAEADWLTALERGLDAYLRYWSDRPNFSAAYLIELPMAGPLAVGQRERHYAPFEAMFAALAARARSEQPELPRLAPRMPRLIVLATTELIAGEARAGRLGSLLGLEPELLEFMVRLLADDETARTAVARLGSPSVRAPIVRRA